MNHSDAIEFLMRDGNLRVSCSRYGSDTEDCAEVAWKAFLAYLEAAPLEGSESDLLDYLMGLVVNDHDDIEYLIANYYIEES